MNSSTTTVIVGNDQRQLNYWLVFLLVGLTGGGGLTPAPPPPEILRSSSGVRRTVPACFFLASAFDALSVFRLISHCRYSAPEKSRSGCLIPGHDTNDDNLI